MYSIYFFFFKQKTAYEMRISDWSSDVCSSDLRPPGVEGVEHTRQAKEEHPFAPGLVVHPADAARRHRQRGECADQRPGAGRQNMKVVVLGTGHRTYPFVLVLASRPLSALRSTG